MGLRCVRLGRLWHRSPHPSVYLPQVQTVLGKQVSTNPDFSTKPLDKAVDKFFDQRDGLC